MIQTTTKEINSLKFGRSDNQIFVMDKSKTDLMHITVILYFSFFIIFIVNNGNILVSKSTCNKKTRRIRIIPFSDSSSLKNHFVSLILLLLLKAVHLETKNVLIMF